MDAVYAYSSPIQIPGTTWKTVQNDRQSYMATKTDGTLWGWGLNITGQLGVNNKTYYSSPIQIPGTTWDKNFGGYMVTGVIKNDGT